MIDTSVLPSHSLVQTRRGRTSILWFFGPLLLLILQVITGTDPAFACLVLLFTILFSLTLSLLNGLKTLTGCCVFFLGMQNVIVSQFAQIYFGEAAEARLILPNETMEVYDLFMFGVLLAVLTLRIPIFTRRKTSFCC